MAAAPLDPHMAAERLNERAQGTNIAARGTRFLHVSAERAVAELAFRPDLAQLTGLFHGGVILSLADETATACSLATVMPDGTWDPGKFPLTIQLSANLIRNANAGKLIAEAVPVHRGRASMVMQTTVRDEQGRVMALVTATLLVVNRS
ncbi:MAG TPA: PaaI family thioesterase [Candidatus Tectomicrobia bacterium]|nr:PaaI family thioesterase [Candidatus Tectomicrobia bacterium]